MSAVVKDSKHLVDDLLVKAGAYVQVFDVLRLVDAEKGQLLELHAGEAVETPVHCTDILGSQERCKNCTSIRAYYSGETVVKFEYAGDSVFLVMSVPIEVNKRRCVVEMIKDITKSMTTDVAEAGRNTSVESILSGLNVLTQTDPLTGIFNKRYLLEQLPKCMNSCASLASPLSIILLDIDFFKKINDTLGHLFGDAVLRDLGGILQGFSKRQSDWVARYGGEEFVLCFPGAAQSVCRQVAEDVRASVERHRFTFDGQEATVTVSAGVAAMRPGDDMNSLLERADRNLYQAKKNGRNCIVADA